MPTPPVQTLSDLMRAKIDYELRTGSDACALVLPAANRFARSSPQSLLGLSVAFDAALAPFQAIFFDRPEHFARYAAKLRAQ
jgi:hypothetical protein